MYDIPLDNKMNGRRKKNHVLVHNCIDKGRSGRRLLGLEEAESVGDRIGYPIEPDYGGTNSVALSEEEYSANLFSLSRSASASFSS